jgi:4-hydroxy-2-oxoheptanedioate aldolase
MKNRLKQMLSEGKVAVGPQLRFGSPAIVELFAWAGFDFVILDCEHAPQTPTGVRAQLQAVTATTTTALVCKRRSERVPPGGTTMYHPVGI